MLSPSTCPYYSHWKLVQWNDCPDYIQRDLKKKGFLWLSIDENERVLKSWSIHVNYLLCLCSYENLKIKHEDISLENLFIS